MSLAPGAKLHEFEIVDTLGAGGMGEVYRARDTKLDREVAIKVLPEELAHDRDRLSRFEREAKLLAALNHTNIAHLYGFEEDQGKSFLIMELVEGETLAERIARGPLAVDEAQSLFTQIADALEAAHEKGIIHRDLKPANIKITPDGQIKILDFGLAKAFLSGNEASAEISQSPTLTKATALGTIMGTAAYMSPEQARGKSVDRRSDIWAFGVVLYEALTGARMFAGETVSDVLAAVLRAEISFRALPTDTPDATRRLLRRCLERDVPKRLGWIGDARLELADRHALASGETAVEQPVRGWRWLAVSSSVALAVALLALWRASPDVGRNVYRLVVSMPEGLATRTSALALSPNGRELVYVGLTETGPMLFLRSLDALEATAIPGTDGANRPFFSADGDWIGFHDGVRDETKKVSLRDNQPITTLARPATFGGGSWSDDGFIYYGRPFLRELRKVSSSGGEPEVIGTRDDNVACVEVLPGGEVVLATVGRDTQALRLEDGTWNALLQDATCARYALSGHLVFVRDRALFAVPFDLERVEIRGVPVPVVDGIATAGWSAQFALSAAGHLVYVPLWRRDVVMVRLDRSGQSTILSKASGAYYAPEISPDGNSIAFRDAESDIVVYDWQRDALRRVTFDVAGASFPVWSPDSQRLIYRTSTDGRLSLESVRADGSAQPDRLVDFDLPFSTDAGPNDVSPDGSVLLLTTISAGEFGTQHYIMALALDGAAANGTSSLEVIVRTPVADRHARISPDGRWIAYQSGMLGGDQEVYVEPFRLPGGRSQVSGGGGRDPRWSPKGDELFYRNGDRVFSVSYRVDGDAFETDRPRELFRADVLTDDRSYDVFPDGEHFLMLQPAGGQSVAPTEAVVVLNWVEELKRLVPIGN